jgi:outer membrane protein assembly factor BamB
MQNQVVPCRQTICAVFVCFLVSLAFASPPGDWPQWRGPNRDDISTERGLLKKWPAEGPRLAWKANDLGNGYSTVAIAGNRIFTTGDRKDSSFVIALNLADGKPLWSAKLGKPGDLGGYVGPRGTPTVDGDLLYVISQWGDFVCLEAATGNEKWRKSFTKDFEGTLPNWGYAESPLVDGDKVVSTPGGAQGAVVALNKMTGAPVWRSTDFTDSAHYSSLIIAEPGGVRQYLQLTAASVAGVAAADGKLLWRAARKGDVAVIPTPIYDNGFVYVASGYGVGCNLFKITANGGKFSTSQVYANKVMVNHHGGVIKLDDFLYGYSDGKGWTCQEFKSGDAKWQNKEKLGKGCLAYADGHFYLRQEEGPGTVALIEASPEGYKEHGRFNPPDRSRQRAWPHPVIAGGKLYLRDQDTLLCYDVLAK